MQKETIKKLIEESVADAQVIVEGEDGRHFTATVISPAFVNKNRVQKQQLVYQAVNTYLRDGSLHALSLKTFTPDEWQMQNNRG